MPPNGHPASSRVVGRKLGLYEYPGGLHPSLDDLEDTVRTAHAGGHAVAIHAVSLEAVVGALHVLERCGNGKADRPDRIEHASQMSDPEIARAARLGVQVCVNPALIEDRGDVYLEDPRAPLLHRYEAMRAAGIPLMAGSDSPVSGPSPVRGVRAAMNRKTGSGSQMSPNEGLRLLDALDLYTRVPAVWLHGPNEGEVRPGADATFTVVSGDWTQGIPDQTRIAATVVEGRVVFLEEQSVVGPVTRP